mgnify:CR=1 FL=1
MTINKFIKVCSREESPIGDFAKDIIREEDFPFIESNEQVLELLQSRANRFGLIKVYNEFKIEFEKSK